MMSQMSMSYPVMQIMGYQKIDASSNLLITENENFSFYPKKTRTATAQELKTDSEAKERLRSSENKRRRLPSFKPGTDRQKLKSAAAHRPSMLKRVPTDAMTMSKRGGSTNMTSYLKEVHNPTDHL